MKRVTGIGGVFFQSADAPRLRAWYRDRLGIDVQVWGGAAFDWTDEAGQPMRGTTAWSLNAAEDRAFAPSQAPFMVNYRVADLRGLVKVLAEEGVSLVGDLQESEYGRFAWVLDPDGNKVELWEPPAGS